MDPFKDLLLLFHIYITVLNKIKREKESYNEVKKAERLREYLYGRQKIYKNASLAVCFARGNENEAVED